MYLRTANNEKQFLFQSIKREWFNGKEIGMLGEIHPTTLKKEGIDPTVYFEMDLTKFLEIKTSKVRYTPVSKFPAVTRDIAIIVKDDVAISSCL